MDFEALYQAAKSAANLAYVSCRPTPMQVFTPMSLTGIGAGIPDPSKPIYHVDDGACGFAWVTLDGRDPMAKWFKSKSVGSKGYPKGWQLWSYDCLDVDKGQSIDRKLAGCRAFAQVLKDAGFAAYAGSRLD